MQTDYNVVAISDLHGYLPKNLPKGELLFICGDICPVNESHHPTHQEHWVKQTFLPWVKNQAEQIAFIPGNHDFYFERLFNLQKEDEFRVTLPKNVHYLRDSMIELNGLKIYGTPWTPTFGRWAWMKNEGILENIFAMIPEEVDFLLSHGPAYGMSDSCLQAGWENVQYVGSKSLREVIQCKQIKHLLYGHIHTANHNIKTVLNSKNQETKYNCVSIFNENYEATYPAFTLNFLKQI